MLTVLYSVYCILLTPLLLKLTKAAKIYVQLSTSTVAATQCVLRVFLLQHYSYQYQCTASHTLYASTVYRRQLVIVANMVMLRAKYTNHTRWTQRNLRAWRVLRLTVVLNKYTFSSALPAAAPLRSTRRKNALRKNEHSVQRSCSYCWQ